MFDDVCYVEDGAVVLWDGDVARKEEVSFRSALRICFA
jgi:hypothetical protein